MSRVHCCETCFGETVFQATVLEEMPPFPERESSILAKLKKKKPTVAESTENKEHKMPAVQVSSGGSDGPALQVSDCHGTGEGALWTG